MVDDILYDHRVLPSFERPSFASCEGILRDSLIWDRIWCDWFCSRRIVPSLPRFVLSLLPAGDSLSPGVTGGAGVGHGRKARDKEAGDGEVSKKKGGRHIIVAQGC